MNRFVKSYANTVTALLEMKLVVADFYQHCILNMGGIVTQRSNQVVETGSVQINLASSFLRYPFLLVPYSCVWGITLAYCKNCCYWKLEILQQRACFLTT